MTKDRGPLLEGLAWVLLGLTLMVFLAKLACYYRD